MTAKAGDTVLAIDSVTITHDGRCKATVSVEVVGKDARHPITTRTINVELTDDQKRAAFSLREAVAAAIGATPPIPGVAIVEPQSRLDRKKSREASIAAHRAARGIKDEPATQAPPPTDNRPAKPEKPTEPVVETPAAEPATPVTPADDKPTKPEKPSK